MTSLSHPSNSTRQRGIATLGARAAVTAALALSFAACNAPTQQDMQAAQALQDLGESLNDLRQVQQTLQDQVDSLRIVVVRQDSTIRTLANLAGVAMPSR